MVSVLFVCLGNICRSPTAEGMFRSHCARAGLADSIQIDSAGTGAYHLGSPPDARAQAAARKRGIDLSNQRARQVTHDDFASFDYVLAMDRDNLSALMQRCPPEYRQRLSLFLAFAEDLAVREVPDPYYGDDDGFETVLDLVDAASAGLIADIRRAALRKNASSGY